MVKDFRIGWRVVLGQLMTLNVVRRILSRRWREKGEGMRMAVGDWDDRRTTDSWLHLEAGKGKDRHCGGVAVPA